MISSNKIYKLPDMPKIKEYYIYIDGVKFFVGTILRRPNSIGLVFHYGILLGVCEDNIIWIIEENSWQGVSVLSIKDWLDDWWEDEVEYDGVVSLKYKNDIIQRAIERSSKKFHIYNNNCETFATFVSYGAKFKGFQSLIVDLIFQIGLIYPNYIAEQGTDKLKIRWKLFKRRISHPVNLITIVQKNEVKSLPVHD